MARIVVIGAGMGGLAVAARLAAQGHAVTVCEQSSEIGGKLGWFTRDGFAFDTGPSLLTLPAVYRDLFLKTGEALERSVELVPVDPVAHYRFPATEAAGVTELDLPNASRGRTTAALDAAFGEGAGVQWADLLGRAGGIWDVARGPFLESALDGPATLLRLSRRLSGLRMVAPWRSLRGLGRQYLRDDRLQMMLDRYATYAGSDPRRAPAALATIAFVEHAFGAWYVRGGLFRLGEALHQRVLDVGAHVQLAASVTSVLVEGGKVAGVEIDGRHRIDADLVVSDADATHLYGDLVADPAAAPARRALARGTPSLSGFVLLLALRGRTPSLAHHSVLFGGDYDDEFDSVFGTGRHRGNPQPAADPTIYISAPDDPALRPTEDHESWFVLVNAPRHSVDDPSAGIDWDAPGLATSYADRVLDLMAERGHDVRGRIVWREVRTPADLARDTRSVGGSIYGTSSCGARSAFLRPANRSPVPGLFLVGGSAHPGGGLPLVGLSAAIVAEQIGRA